MTEGRQVTVRFRATNKDIFDAIRTGKKKVETRAGTKKYIRLVQGDVLVCVCGKEKLEKKITKVTHSKTLAGLLKKYRPSAITPWAKTSKELEAIYYSFPGYKEKIKKFGIVAFEIK